MLTDGFPDLIAKSRFETQNGLVTNEIMSNIVYKSCLYAKQDQNNQNFEASNERMV